MAHEADLVVDAPAVEALFHEHWVTAWRAAHAVTGRADHRRRRGKPGDDEPLSF